LNALSTSLQRLNLFENLNLDQELKNSKKYYKFLIVTALTKEYIIPKENEGSQNSNSVET
jgi:hypothetical protein